MPRAAEPAGLYNEAALVRGAKALGMRSAAHGG